MAAQAEAGRIARTRTIDGLLPSLCAPLTTSTSRFRLPYQADVDELRMGERRQRRHPGSSDRACDQARRSPSCASVRRIDHHVFPPAKQMIGVYRSGTCNPIQMR